MRWTLHPGYNVNVMYPSTSFPRRRVVVGRLEWNSFTQRETEEPTENTKNCCEVEICRE